MHNTEQGDRGIQATPFKRDVKDPKRVCPIVNGLSQLIDFSIVLFHPVGCRNEQQTGKAEEKFEDERWMCVQPGGKTWHGGSCNSNPFLSGVIPVLLLLLSWL